MKRKMLIAIVSIGSLVCATVALGQDFSSPYAGNGLAGLITNQTAITQSAVGSRVSNTTKLPSRKQQSTKSKLNLVALSFKVSTTNRKRNLAQFVRKTRITDPAGAEKMQQVFASTDVMGKIDKAMTNIGLRSDNVADAYAVYWTNAWLGSRGRSDNLPGSQIIAVRNQAAGALLVTPQFTSATDAQKQEMAEAMLIHSAIISASIDRAKSDPALMAKLRVAIAQGAKGIGLELDRMTLTTQGFRFTN